MKKSSTGRHSNEASSLDFTELNAIFEYAIIKVAADHWKDLPMPEWWDWPEKRERFLAQIEAAMLERYIESGIKNQELE